MLTLNQASSYGPPCLFARSVALGPPETEYGYFVLCLATGNLLWAQEFDTPVLITNPGDQVLFVPQFSFLSQY